MYWHFEEAKIIWALQAVDFWNNHFSFRKQWFILAKNVIEIVICCCLKTGCWIFPGLFPMNQAKKVC